MKILKKIRKIALKLAQTESTSLLPQKWPCIDIRIFELYPVPQQKVVRGVELSEWQRLLELPLSRRGSIPKSDDTTYLGGIITSIWTWSITICLLKFLPLHSGTVLVKFSLFLTILPIDNFSSILRCEDYMLLTEPFRMCQILFFRHKKHLFDWELELEQLRFIKLSALTFDYYFIKSLI